MKINRLLWVILIVVLLVPFAALAQDTEPLATLNGEPVEATQVAPGEQPSVVMVDSPQSTAMFYVFAAVIFGLLAVIALVLRPLIVQLGGSAPSWAVDAAFSAVNNLLKSAQDYANTTPSPVDNDLVTELQQQIAEMKAEIDVLRGNLPRAIRAPDTGSHPVG